MRFIFYPERFAWTTIEEAVYDWIQQQSGDLLSDYWLQGGIACNCHSLFGEFCVIELGRGVVDKQIHEHQTLKHVYAGSGMNVFNAELEAENYPNRYTEKIAYNQLELEYL